MTLHLASLMLGAAALCVATPARAAGREPVQASVRVDVSALPDGDVTAQVAENLRTGAVDVLRDGGVEIVEGAQTIVSIRIRRYGEDDVHYEATTGIDTGEGDALEAERTFGCELCTDSELQAKVTQDVARLSGWLSGHGTATPDPAPAADPPPAPQADPPQDKGVRRPLLIGGAVGVGLGAAGIIAGAVVLSQGAAETFTNADASVRSRDLRRLGLGVLGAGGVFLAVGLPLMLTDLVRHRRAARARTRVAWSPLWLHGPALSMQGRF